MSRSGYVDDLDNWQLIKYRGQVASALRGKRGQQFLRDLIAALDAMPVKELIGDDLIDEEGRVCALGALGKAKGLDMARLDPYDAEMVSATFDIAEQLAREVMFENDEYSGDDNAGRWRRMRRWAESHLHSVDSPRRVVRPAWARRKQSPHE